MLVCTKILGVFTRSEKVIEAADIRQVTDRLDLGRLRVEAFCDTPAGHMLRETARLAAGLGSVDGSPRFVVLGLSKMLCRRYMVYMVGPCIQFKVRVDGGSIV